MRVDEVDIDHLVDYKTEYSRIIPKYKISGDNLTGLLKKNCFLSS